MKQEHITQKRPNNKTKNHTYDASSKAQNNNKQGNPIRTSTEDHAKRPTGRITGNTRAHGTTHDGLMLHMHCGVAST
jgi:hypothetical protein